MKLSHKISLSPSHTDPLAAGGLASPGDIQPRVTYLNLYITEIREVIHICSHFEILAECIYVHPE